LHIINIVIMILVMSTFTEAIATKLIYGKVTNASEI